MLPACFAELGYHIKDLPDGPDIVPYSRGPYCVFAYDAVRLLTAAGRVAPRLEDGFPEWRTEHLPVESGRR